MPTNKVVLRSTDEFMADYQPQYQPLYPLFLGKSQQYSEEVGTINFKRMETIGSIRAEHVTPKDTELKQIAVGQGSKAFKKYFLANQYIQSALQDREGTEDVVAQVLDEHQKQADELLLFGDGATNGAQVNNGLIFSSDSNHITNAAGANVADLNDLHGRIMSVVSQASSIGGRKALIVYGSTAQARVNSIYTTQPVAFRRVLQDSLPANTTIIEMPTDVAPAGNGVVLVGLDQVKLHYVKLPSLQAQGVNDEKMYAWHNFLMGSMMLEVLAKKAVVHQPLAWA